MAQWLEPRFSEAPKSNGVWLYRGSSWEYQALIALKKSAALEGFPDGLVVNNPHASAGEAGLIPGLKDPVEEGVATHSIFLPGKSHGQKGLEGYSPWGHKESDETK